MQLKSVGGKKVEANTIACILRGRIAGAEATLVQLKTGDEVLLDNSEEEVVDEMNKFDIDR
jgi:predicted transcriptional regulator